METEVVTQLAEEGHFLPCSKASGLRRMHSDVLTVAFPQIAKIHFDQ